MLVCAFTRASCTRDRGCSAHPGIPRSLWERIGSFLANLARNARRECEGMSKLHQRHCERSEAIHLGAPRKNGLLRRFAPRNDAGLIEQRRPGLDPGPIRRGPSMKTPAFDAFRAT